MRGEPALAWLRTRDPGLAATKRAVRVTAAACVAFYACRYGLGSRVMATYAIFGVIALGALSEVSGPPARRSRILLGCLGAGAVLVTAGTVLAADSLAAAAGMLLVGFLVAFAGVGGPRLTGLANGMQLLYILPSFPPYAPDTLPARLAGLAVGVVALVIADRLLWPVPAPACFRSRLAEVAGAVLAQLSAVSATASASAAGTMPRDRQELTNREVAAEGAVDRLRLSRLAPGERPAGPGARDRGLVHAAATLRALHHRLSVLGDLLAGPVAPGSVPDGTAELLTGVAESLDAVRAALLGEAPAPTVGRLDRVLSRYARRRIGQLASGGVSAEPSRWARLGVESAEAADLARTLILATRAALGAPEPASAAAETGPDGRFWYATAPRWRLWWRRLRAHLTPRSVYLQNAARLAVGLAAARLVAGELGLSHGFWVLLTILTVLRTSVAATGRALLPTLAGTLVGAVVSAGIIAAGPTEAGYAALLPVALLLALTATAVLGTAVGQACFTVTVAVLFAQLSTVDWRLAGTRLLDVLLGGLVGLLAGIAAWPRGGVGEVRRAAAASLAADADYLRYTADRLAGTADPGGAARLAARARHLAALFDASYGQFFSERAARRDDRVTWQAVLGVAHGVLRGADSLLRRYPAPTPLPWPEAAGRLRAEAALVAAGYRQAAATLRRGAAPGRPPATANARLPNAGRDPGFGGEAVMVREAARAPEAAMRLLDALGWLAGIADDLARLTAASRPG